MKTAALWASALVVAAVLLVATNYSSRDPDSALYARLAADLAKAPPSRWIAPEWGGAWNAQGLFREHPAGILLLPAALISVGFPEGQASFVVNMLYQVAALLLIPALAAVVVRRTDAQSLAWVLQLLPVSFAYRIRANQEHPLLMGLLAVLYGTHRARTQPAWLLLTVASFCFIVLIKGAFAMFALVAAALWLLALPTPERGSDRWPWAGLAIAVAAAVGMMFAYEAVYVRTTGESFLDFYNSRRLGASIDLTDPRVIAHAVANAGWYLIRLVWFAAPWSVAAAFAIWVWMRSRIGGARLAIDVATERALIWSIAIAAVYIAVLSPVLVRAERFIFPLYFIFGSVGFVAAIRVSPRLADVVRRTSRYAWLPVAVWMLTFLLSLGSRLGRM